MNEIAPSRPALPSIETVLTRPDIVSLVSAYGRRPVLQSIRQRMEDARAGAPFHVDTLAHSLGLDLAARQSIGLKAVFNLTGTVLHTNLGRAPLAEEAVAAMVQAASASAVEYDLKSGRRGERDAHVERWLCALTGAEAALVVNNNAAAVLLALNTIAARKEVPVSRGELVEIGGAFRVPDVMKRASAKLIEVGTTNRTHLKDYAEAISPKTGALMSVHPSNYAIQGFSSKPDASEIAHLAHKNDLPYVDDLGSGAIIDMTALGLPAERTAAAALEAGADIVTFSGDKLLGGPQAGLVVGRRDLVERMRKNPLKRAMRLDKVMLAALEATLILYDDPARAAKRIPSLRLLARPADEILVLAKHLAPAFAAAIGKNYSVTAEPCQSQIGSGALPVDRLDSAALVARPISKRGKGSALKQLASALRRLPQPVVGRIADDALWLDLRCLEDKATFAAQLKELRL